MLDTRFLILDSRYSMLDTRYLAGVAEIFGLTSFESEDIMQYKYRRRLMTKMIRLQLKWFDKFTIERL